MAKKTSSTTKGVSKKKAIPKRTTKQQVAKKAVGDKLAQAKPKTKIQHDLLATRIHQFLPPPRHSARWWERQNTVFEGGPIATVSVPGLISAKTCLLRVVAEVGPGADGSFCVFFPTISDCLLWFRWQAIPCCKYTLEEGEYTPEEKAEISKVNLRLAKQIDKAKPNTDAYKLFKSLESVLFAVLRDRDLFRLDSIHEFLTEHGSLTAWRRALQSDQITCDRGFWTMPRKAWSRLEQVLEPCITGECDSIDPSEVDPKCWTDLGLG